MIIKILDYDVIIDEDDYKMVSSYKWYVKRCKNPNLIYFSANLPTVNGKQPKLWLHRFIMKCYTGDGRVVDHINRNTLDNRKCNLRVVTDYENSLNRQNRITNTSGYKGVSYNKKDSIYVARIQDKGKIRRIGISQDPVECAKMYDMMAIKLFGEYACINFPDMVYTQEEIDSTYMYMMDSRIKANTSGYTGVNWVDRECKWRAYITYKRKFYSLGYYDDPIEAAKAYDRRAIEFYGERARLNFPEEWSTNA